MTAPHNVAIGMVFLVLGGVVALTVAPYELGTIRLAGVSLLWWYGVIAAPLLTVTITIAALLRPGSRHAPTPDSPSVPAPE
jgi:hypothetical protein